MTTTITHHVHIDHVEPGTTLISIFARGGASLPMLTVRGESFPCQGFSVWRTSRGTWNIESDGTDVAERSTRTIAINTALRMVSIRRTDANVSLTEDVEY